MNLKVSGQCNSQLTHLCFHTLRRDVSWIFFSFVEIKKRKKEKSYCSAGVDDNDSVIASLESGLISHLDENSLKATTDEILDNLLKNLIETE